MATDIRQGGVIEGVKDDEGGGGGLAEMMV